MRVLLVVPRFGNNWGDFYQFPLGLGYIASAMKRAGHEVIGLNLNHHRGDVNQLIVAKVAEVGPDVCATGGLSPYLPVIREIFAAARHARPGIINIAGGGVVSGDPEISLQVMDLDVGVIGKGEVTIVALLDALQRSADLAAVDGIIFRERNGRVVRTPPRAPVMDLSEIAWPDYELLDCEHHLSTQRVLDHHFFHTQPESRPRAVDMITSRSCPFSCTFCFHPVGKVYRERPLDEFFQELDFMVARYQINTVGLIDELFSLRKQRLMEFCERIKPYKLQWMVQLHVSSANGEILDAMREAGCSYISYGIESMSQPVLESMKKKTKRERIEQALADTFTRNVGIQGNLIFGDTAETLETANESMHWWAGNRDYQVNLSRLQVFPGSPDYIEAVEDGLIVDRKGFVETLPDINISSMNGKNLEMLGMQLGVHAQTLFNLAPLRFFKLSGNQLPGRGPAYDIAWDCPRCGHGNEYLGGILRPDHGRSLRLFCRNCRSRWDIENKAYGHGEKIAHQLKRAGRKAKSLLKQKLAQLRRHAKHEHMLWSSASALALSPFDVGKHSAFADALLEAGAFGAARLHYLQALALSPGNSRARAGISYIDGPEVNDAQRATYFISRSDGPASMRARRGEDRSRRRHVAFPIFSHVGDREPIEIK